MIIISHNLADVFEVADDITVLYLGQMVASARRERDHPRRRRRLHHRHARPRQERAHEHAEDAPPAPSAAPTETSATDDRGDLIGSGQEGGLGDQVRAWWQRVRGGDMGALPAVGGFVVLSILFTRPQPVLPHRAQLREPADPGGDARHARHGARVRAAARRDRPVRRRHGRRRRWRCSSCSSTCSGVPWIARARCSRSAFGILTGTFIGFFVARVGIPSFVVTLGLFLGLSGPRAHRSSARAACTACRSPRSSRIQNSNMPRLGRLGDARGHPRRLGRRPRSGTARAARAPACRTARSRSSGSSSASSPCIGGAVVCVLNQNRGQSVGAVEGVPIVVPIVLVDPLDRHVRARPHEVTAATSTRSAATPRPPAAAGVKVVLIRWTAFIVLLDPRGRRRACSRISKVGSVDAAAGRDIVLERRRRGRRRRREPLRRTRSPHARRDRRARDRGDHERPRPAQPAGGRQLRGHRRRAHPRGDGRRGLAASARAARSCAPEPRRPT